MVGSCLFQWGHFLLLLTLESCNRFFSVANEYEHELSLAATCAILYKKREISLNKTTEATFLVKHLSHSTVLGWVCLLQVNDAKISSFRTVTLGIGCRTNSAKYTASHRLENSVRDACPQIVLSP